MHSREVARSGLVARLSKAHPALIGMYAPVGFGKSTLARQYLRLHPGRICDCERARDDLDLARRLFPELGSDLGDGSVSHANRVDRAVAEWAGLAGTVIFENLEAAGIEARAFVTRLLLLRPPSATVIICARDDARVQLTRYASPHDVVTLRAADLAFDLADVRSLFGGAHTVEQLEGVLRVTKGWPLAVSMLSRVANEGRGEALFANLERVAFEELRDYLADDVLSQIAPRVAQALFACASIPHATAAELHEAFGDPQLVSDLTDFSKDSPFVSRGDAGTFEIHPLLAMLLVEHQGERRAMLLRDLASTREDAGDFERSAELHAARGDQHAAARVLAKHEVLADRRPSDRYRTVLHGLDRAVVARYPRLWAIWTIGRLLRVETERLADEAEAILRTVPPDVSGMERFYVVLLRVIFAVDAGAPVEASELLSSFEDSANLNDPPISLLDGAVAYLRAFVDARNGSFTKAESGLNRALAIVGDVDLLASAIFLCLGADIARVRGKRALVVQFLERALERAQSSRLPNIVAIIHAEALFGAWFTGDKAVLAAETDALEECVRLWDLKGFHYLLACARGRRAEPGPLDAPRSVIHGRLIALATTRDPNERVRIAELAFSNAVRLGQPFLEVLAALALGGCDELRFADCQSAAMEASLRCESPALARALTFVAERRTDLGMLSAFVAAIARGRSEAPPPVAIDVTAGRVRVDGQAVTLSGRELELIVALGLRRESTSRARLASLLWPDLDEGAARNSMSVCLHRLRTHLGRTDAIVRDGDGYRLHDDAIVDLWEIERSAAYLRARGTLRDADRAALERSWSRLRETPPNRMEQWDWFAPMQRRLRELRVEISYRLAAEALARGDTAEALQFACDVIDLDPCDEPAHEVVIRAHLLAGDRAAALRVFRQYRQTLHEELGAEPSDAIAAMVAQL